MKNLQYKKHYKCHLISNDVMENGILIGCHQGLKKQDLSNITKIFRKFVKYKNL